MSISITLKFGTNDNRRAMVNPDDKIYVLIEKLHLNDEDTKFIYQGKTYEVSSIKTFRKIGITTNTVLFAINQAVAGK